MKDGLRLVITVAFLASWMMYRSPAAGQGSDSAVAFTHVNVIDGTGAVMKRDYTVVTSGGRITALGDAVRTSVPPNAQTVDGTGKYLIPGLWDLHVHTRYDGIDHLRLFIANGVTGVRDMGGPWEHFDAIKSWRREIANGDRTGPRIVAAGALLDGPGSQLGFSAIVGGPDEARAVVRRVRESGADFVKVYDLLGRDAFAAVIDEARKLQLPVAGHPPVAVGLREVSNAGVVSVEHLSTFILASSSKREDGSASASDLAPVEMQRLMLSGGFDRSRAASLAAVLSRNRTVIVPTLSNWWMTLATTRQNAEVSNRLRYVPPAYRSMWAAPGSRDPAMFEAVREIARLLHEAGVELLAGTDAVKPQLIPGFSLHDELSLLVSVGLSPSEALEGATRKSARLLGYMDVGTIEAGMGADLVLLDADPLQNIENTRRIVTVMSRGRLFDQRSLNAMLAEVENEAARWTGTPTGLTIGPGR